MMRPSIQMEKKIAFMPPSRMRGMSTWPSGLRLPRSKFLEKKRCVVSSCVSSTIEEKCSFRARSAMSSALEGAPSCEPASKTPQRHKLVVKRRLNRFKWRSPGATREMCPQKCQRDCNLSNALRHLSKLFQPRYSAGAAGDGLRPFGKGALDVVCVGLCDDFQPDLFRASRFAFANVGAIGESFAIHLPHHGQSATVPFRLPLREMCQVRNLRADEQCCRGVRAGGHARPAADARRRVHRQVGVLLANRHSVPVRGAASWHGN